ncbi:MAG: ABC transporter permease [Acidobacteriota bacterium]
MLTNALGGTGRTVLGLFRGTGSLTLLGLRMTGVLLRSVLPGAPFRRITILQQAAAMGIGALPIVTLISWMMGLILAFQAAYQLGRLGMESYVADLVAVSMTRELGPVITAIVVAGRSGSAVAAEIATMKIQEELDALQVMGVSIQSFLIAPKLAAMVLCLPLLTAWADLISILGGLACAAVVLDIPAVAYLERTQESLYMLDFLSGLAKAGVFGVLIVTVGVWCGLNVEGGAAGVGRATTRAVVLGIFCVILADLVATGLFYALA